MSTYKLAKLIEGCIVFVILGLFTGLALYRTNDLYPGQDWRLELEVVAHMIMFGFWFLCTGVLTWMEPRYPPLFAMPFRLMLIVLLFVAFFCTEYAVIKLYYSLYWRVSGRT